jgi:hypothetical protein
MFAAGFGAVALGAVDGVASAGGLVRVITAIATDGRAIPEGVLVALRGRPVSMQRSATRD